MPSRWWMRGMFVVLLVAVAAGSSMAMSSLTGPTGIVGTPTAAVAMPGTLEAALTYQRMSGSLGSSAEMYDGVDAVEATQLGGEDSDMTVWGGELLGGLSGKGEYWLLYDALKDGHDSHVWGGGGKFMLMEEPKKSVNLAVGVGYWSWTNAFEMYDGSSLDVGIWNAYLVATKDFSTMYKQASSSKTKTLGSLGVMYLRIDPDQGESDSLFRPFVNVQVMGDKGTSLGLEYRWKDSSIDNKAVFSAVVRHEFQRDWSGEVGYTNSTPFGVGLSDYNAFVRVAYRFGYGKGGGGGY